ncbi:MAG: RluA family pseudouridine synthase [Christensenellaceae bacterium]|jgi:23S rRNA pseudouridine1911/1915/1917 synthase|nr:RluA family pseudouridine synthase [Christensenellaceae bacterium]
MSEPAVIFEDNRIIVVIKPRNAPCVADDSGDESLQEQLKSFIKARDGKDGNAFVGVVHRLDRVTGGVMVYAKNSKSAARLSEEIKSGAFKKTYLAVVKGDPKQKSATLVNYLAKDENKNVVAVVPQTTTGAKRAELYYEVVGTKNGYSLLKINLGTGRSHQIRVQLKYIGYPLVGDNRYGGVKADNIALWAYQLEFVHPGTDDNMKFIVNPPEDGVWANFDFDRREHKLRGKAGGVGSANDIGATGGVANSAGSADGANATGGVGSANDMGATDGVTVPNVKDVANSGGRAVVVNATGGVDGVMVANIKDGANATGIAEGGAE